MVGGVTAYVGFGSGGRTGRQLEGNETSIWHRAPKEHLLAAGTRQMFMGSRLPKVAGAHWLLMLTDDQKEAKINELLAMTQGSVRAKVARLTSRVPAGRRRRMIIFKE